MVAVPTGGPDGVVGAVVADVGAGAANPLVVVGGLLSAADGVCGVPAVVLHPAINATSDARPVTAAADIRFVIVVV